MLVLRPVLRPPYFTRCACSFRFHVKTFWRCRPRLRLGSLSIVSPARVPRPGSQIRAAFVLVLACPLPFGLFASFVWVVHPPELSAAPQRFSCTRAQLRPRSRLFSWLTVRGRLSDPPARVGLWVPRLAFAARLTTRPAPLGLFVPPVDPPHGARFDGCGFARLLLRVYTFTDGVDLNHGRAHSLSIVI